MNFMVKHDVVPRAGSKIRKIGDVEHVMPNKSPFFPAQLTQATSAAAGDVAGGGHAGG